MQTIVLNESDAERFLRFRADGLAGDTAAFRVSAQDDVDLGFAAWQARLTRDFVVAVADREAWSAIGGFSRFAGAKLRHKGLIWGMYAAPAARGSGAADLLMTALLDHARTLVRQVQLTVMADNTRARRFYEKHGFRLYGIEPMSVRREDAYADEALMWRSFADLKD